MKPCPCGSQNDYANCCNPFHCFDKLPNNATQLMRSRFSSFYLKNIDYVVATTLPAQQPLLDKLALQTWANDTNWTHLDVISHHNIGKRHAQVHFKAYFDNGQGEQLHEELSAFVKADERWYFLDHTLPTKLTNKQPCLCGSGEKFKMCCGRFLE